MVLAERQPAILRHPVTTEVAFWKSFAETSPKPSNKRSDKPELFQVQRYVDRFRNDEHYATREARADMLRYDTLHLVKEFSQLELVTTFDMRLPLGTDELLGDGYFEDMGILTQGFIHELSQRGLSTHRAIIEWLVFSRLKHLIRKQASTTPQRELATTRWVIVSPPGKVEDGYHGADSLEPHRWHAKEAHHSFVYVYEASLSPNGSEVLVKATQLRTWHNIAQHIELMQSLDSTFAADPSEPIDAQIIGNIVQLEFYPTETPQEIAKQIWDLLYRESHTWWFKPDQVPHFPHKEQVDAEIATFMEEFYLEEALNIIDSLTNLDPASLEYHQLLQKIDILTTTFLAAIDQRLREVNTNSKYEQRVLLSKLARMFSHPLEVPFLLQQLSKPDSSTTLQSRIRDLYTIYQNLYKTKVLHLELTEEERAWMSSTAPQIVSIGNFVAGSALCYSVAPFTLAFKATSELHHLSSLGMNAEITTHLEQLPTEEKKALLENLLKLDYVELDLTQEGASKVWMVPREYLSEPGCRVEADGMVSGPCEVDGKFIRFDNSVETQALAMNKDEFNYYIQVLQKQELNNQLEVIENTVDAALTNEGSDATRVKKLLSIVRNDLMKPSISLQELMNNDVFQSSLSLEILRKLLHLIETKTHQTEQLLWEFIVAYLPEKAASLSLEENFQTSHPALAA